MDAKTIKRITDEVRRLRHTGHTVRIVHQYSSLGVLEELQIHHYELSCSQCCREREETSDPNRLKSG